MAPRVLPRGVDTSSLGGLQRFGGGGMQSLAPPYRHRRRPTPLSALCKFKAATTRGLYANNNLFVATRSLLLSTDLLISPNIHKNVAVSCFTTACSLGAVALTRHSAVLSPSPMPQRPAGRPTVSYHS